MGLGTLGVEGELGFRRWGTLAYQLAPTGKWGALGSSLLICVLFALLDEGDRFGSKAVGHLICSQGDPENILVVSVVILGQKTALSCSSGHQQGQIA